MRIQVASPSGRFRNSVGQSLIVVLIILVFVTAMMGTVTVGLLTESRLTAQLHRYMTAYYIARSGLEAAASQLLHDPTEVDSLSDRWCRNEGKLNNVSVGPGTYRVVYLDEATGKPRTGVVDEERKLNVNRAGPAMLRRLHPAFTEEIVNAIVSRRKKQPFVTVYELTTVAPMDEGFLKKEREGAQGGLLSLLTVHGDGAINVNTAPASVLACLEGLSKEQAEKLAAYRTAPEGESKAFKSLDEVRELLGIQWEAFAKLRPQLKVSSSYFSIRSVGRLTDDPDIVRELRQVVRRDKNGLVVLRFEQTR